MHNHVIVNTLRSANLTARQILARIPQAMLSPIPKSRKRGFAFASVKMYQRFVRLGIERRIEKGIKIPEIIGRRRQIGLWQLLKVGRGYFKSCSLAAESK